MRRPSAVESLFIAGLAAGGIGCSPEVEPTPTTPELSSTTIINSALTEDLEFDGTMGPHDTHLAGVDGRCDEHATGIISADLDDITAGESGVSVEASAGILNREGGESLEQGFTARVHKSGIGAFATSDGDVEVVDLADGDAFKQTAVDSAGNTWAFTGDIEEGDFRISVSCTAADPST